MKKTLKKLLAIVLVIILAMSVLTVTSFAAERSIGYDIGQFLGTIVFSPFILIDGLIWIITGVHIFYW